MKSYKLKSGDNVWRIMHSTSLRFINYNGRKTGMIIHSFDSYRFITDDPHFKVKTIVSDLVRVMYEKL